MMPQSLEEEGGLKPSILVELKQLGERVDVLPLVREYVAGLSSVHERLRELSDRDVLKWEATLNAVQLKVAEAAGGSQETSPGFVISKQPRGGRSEEELHVMSEPTKRRLWLRQRNRLVANLPDRFVTTAKD